MFFIIAFFLSVGFVNAESIVNYNGVEFEKNEYNLLSEIYNESYIYTLTNEMYNIITSNDISKIEIKEYNYPIIPLSEVFTTSYKSLKIINNSGYITVLLSWIKEPAIRSYDVMAVRLDGLTLNGTPTFTQTSYVDGKIALSSSGTLKKFTNGFGQSFLLSNGSSINCGMSFFVNGNGTVYATYQHAITNISLSDSTSYSISSSGLGRVLSYSSTISKKYDGMTGVDVYVQ